MSRGKEKKMEKQIQITLTQRDKENVLRLIYAIDRHVGWDSNLINNLSRAFAYNKEQLSTDINALTELGRKISAAFREEDDDDE